MINPSRYPQSFALRLCSVVAGFFFLVGLALSSGELPSVRGLDTYNYVFISMRRRGRSTMAEAVADLEGNSWSIDDNQV